MSDRLLAWVLRVAWAAMPFVAGPLLASLGTGPSVVGWAVWAMVLVGTLVPHPVGLTALRCAAAAALAAAVGASFAAFGDGDRTVAGVAGLAWSALVVVVVFLPATAVTFVNGPAYPNERRYPLAPPGALLFGPVEAAWALVAGLPVAAAALLGGGHWILGSVAAVVAAGAVWFGGRALHGLSRRWVVFVPAGVVLHDPMALADPVLFVRESIMSLQPAPASSPALDLTQAAPGLALELRLRAPLKLQLVKADAETDSVLFTPTRPGQVLAEAARRRLPVTA